MDVQNCVLPWITIYYEWRTSEAREQKNKDIHHYWSKGSTFSSYEMLCLVLWDPEISLEGFGKMQKRLVFMSSY